MTKYSNKHVITIGSYNRVNIKWGHFLFGTAKKGGKIHEIYFYYPHGSAKIKLPRDVLVSWLRAALKTLGDD